MSAQRAKDLAAAGKSNVIVLADWLDTTYWSREGNRLPEGDAARSQVTVIVDKIIDHVEEARRINNDQTDKDGKRWKKDECNWCGSIVLTYVCDGLRRLYFPVEDDMDANETYKAGRELATEIWGRLDSGEKNSKLVAEYQDSMWAEYEKRYPSAKSSRSKKSSSKPKKEEEE